MKLSITIACAMTVAACHAYPKTEAEAYDACAAQAADANMTPDENPEQAPGCYACVAHDEQGTYHMWPMYHVGRQRMTAVLP